MPDVGLSSFARMAMEKIAPHFLLDPDEVGILKKEGKALLQKRDLPKEWPSTGSWHGDAVYSKALENFSPEERQLLEGNRLKPQFFHTTGKDAYPDGTGTALMARTSFPAKKDSVAHGPIAFTPENVAHHELRHSLLERALKGDRSGVGQRAVRKLYEAGQNDPAFKQMVSEAHAGAADLFDYRPPYEVDHKSMSDEIRSRIGDFENDGMGGYIPLHEFYASVKEGTGRMPYRTDKTDMSSFFNELSELIKKKVSQ
jgi:hypothetical protein